MSPIGAFRVIALSCLEHFQRNEYGLQTEGLRFVLKPVSPFAVCVLLLSPALPKSLFCLRQSLAIHLQAHWVTQETGMFLTPHCRQSRLFPPKNCDVLRLRNESKRQIKSTRRAIKRILSMKEYPRAFVQFTAAVYALSDTLPSDLLAFACSQIDQQAKAARKQQAVTALNPNERHAMRIKLQETPL